MKTISFFIPCVPPTVTAQQKGVVVVKGKPRFFKKAKVRESENTFHALLLPHRPAAPLEGPLSVHIAFTFPWRKSEKKRIVEEFFRYPVMTRPDLANLEKSLCDVMTTLRFWHDDAQIAELRMEKRYGDEPGIEIHICDALPTSRSQGHSRW